MLKEALNSQRNKALALINHLLRKLESKCLGDTVICNDEEEACGATVLGCIVKILKGKDAETSLVGSFKDMSLMAFIQMLHKKGIYCQCDNSECGISEVWSRMLRAVEDRDYGLKLSEFTETDRLPLRQKTDLAL